MGLFTVDEDATLDRVAHLLAVYSKISRLDVERDKPFGHLPITVSTRP